MKNGQLRNIIKSNIRIVEQEKEILDWEGDNGFACMSCFNDVLKAAGVSNSKQVTDDIKTILNPTATIESLSKDVMNIVPNLGDEVKEFETSIGLLTCISTEECSSFIPHLKNDLIVMGNQTPEEEFEV